jgi:hypothetical protein
MRIERYIGPKRIVVRANYVMVSLAIAGVGFWNLVHSFN